MATESDDRANAPNASRETVESVTGCFADVLVGLPRDGEWTTVGSQRWKHHASIHALQGTAAVLTNRRALRSRAFRGKRLVCIGVNMSLTCALAKGCVADLSLSVVV